MNRSLIKITEIMCFVFNTYLNLQVFYLEKKTFRKKHLDLVHPILFDLETYFDSKCILQLNF